MIYVGTLSNLKDIISVAGVVVVKIGASWCKPCLAVAPSFLKLSQSYDYPNIRWVKADISKSDGDAHGIYKFCEAKKIPYFCVFKRGELVGGIQSSNIDVIKTFLDSKIKE